MIDNFFDIDINYYDPLYDWFVIDNAFYPLYISNVITMYGGTEGAVYLN